MMIRGAAVLIVTLCLAACGKDTGDVDVRLDIEDSELNLVSAMGKKPGDKNPVEVVVTLENQGTSEKRVRVIGSWKGEGNSGYGGVSGDYNIGPGKATNMIFGTRSQAVTRFVADISTESTPSSDTETLVADAISQAATSGVEGWGIAFTPTPKLSEIPAWPPKGLANGETIEIGTIVFMPLFGRWEMHLHDRKIDPVKGVAMARSDYPALQTINLKLPEEPVSGSVFERAMAYGDGYFQIKKTADAETTTSWNTSVAWAIEITEWQRKPYESGGPVVQVGGSVSGRIYVCFEGGDLSTIGNSFVAGEFKNVPIVYSGRPKI